MAELKKLVAKRKTLRTRVTASHNQIDTFETLPQTKRCGEKAKLLEFKKELLNLDESIQDLKFTDEVDFTDIDLSNEMDSCTNYQCKIQECLATLDSFAASPVVNRNEDARSLLKQPVAPLPKFSGEEEDDLMKFFTEFESTTASYSYPDRDLLLLLSQQVSGKAKVLLKSLEADKQSYKDAKDLLISAFASSDVRKFSSITKLTRLKLGYNDDPFEFISKVKMLQESVKNLDIKSEDFLQYFVWNGLNDNFKSHLVQISTKSKPSISEIVEHFFTANERYSQAQKIYHSKKSSVQSKKEKNSTSFAVNVKEKGNGRQKTCSLCLKAEEKVSDHPIHLCPKFTNPQSKIEQIIKCNGCTKCAGLNHTTANCKFRFDRKCDKCFKWHFRFLCPQWSTGSQDRKKATGTSTTEASSGVVVLKNSTSDSVLPTFTFEVDGTTYRALKDGGSQSSFVSKNLAESHNLTILQRDVKILIEGFNKPQTYLTRVVQVPIKLGDRLHMVSSVVVPDIKVRLNLPRLSDVVKGFRDKGYNLADSFLDRSNDIHQTDFLLGADAAHCLPGNDVCFGNGSMYISSNFGVLLIGKIDNYLRDLNFLPQCDFDDVSNVNTGSIMSLADSQEKVDLGENYIDVFQTHAFLTSSLVHPLDNKDLENLDYKFATKNLNLSVLDDKGKIISSRLQKATDEFLENECSKFTHYDREIYNDESIELHDTLIDYTLKTLSRTDDGRIVVPLLWNGKVSNHLSKNQYLSEVILKSNLRKLSKDNLRLMDETIKGQVEAGIIERIHDVNNYLSEHPGYSFLPHMGVFKPDRETTKCRVVFLSNLCEKMKSKKLSLSHNQAMFAGPTLNQKLSSAFLQLRFGSYLLCYDLKKAFNQLLLNDIDQSKLLFYWFKDVDKQDFSPVVYRNVRLSFGLRCSPFLLMISLYYILVVEAQDDPLKLKELKHLMYGLLYMDNGAVTSDSSEDLRWSYDNLKSIFLPFKFDIQQISTNCQNLQEIINNQYDENPGEVVKLLGLDWNRKTDSIFTKPIVLNSEADTKRTILKSIASQFDLFNFNMPVMNRSRLFMHSLQCMKDLRWDDKLPSNLQREWVNICKQVNTTPLIEIPRFVGPRTGSYKLIAFTDASHVLYGCVVYILHIETGKINFLSAKNRMINA